MFFYRCHGWVMWGGGGGWGGAHVQRSDKKEGELKVKKDSFDLHTPGLCIILSEGGVWATRERLSKLQGKRTQREFLCLTQSQFSMAQQNKQGITAREFSVWFSFFERKLILYCNFWSHFELNVSLLN